MGVKEIIQNEKQSRLQKAFEYLHSKGFIHSVTDLAQKMERARPGVNNALLGKDGYLNDSFLSAFCQKFPIISFEWITTGTGDMVNDTNDTHYDTVDQSSLMNAALAAKDETIQALHDQIDTKNELIDSLRQHLSDLRDKMHYGHSEYGRKGMMASEDLGDV